jgi:hypothetical protein
MKALIVEIVCSFGDDSRDDLCIILMLQSARGSQCLFHRLQRDRRGDDGEGTGLDFDLASKRSTGARASFVRLREYITHIHKGSILGSPR